MNVLVRDLPQADDFSRVLKTVTAIAQGATSYQKIAAAIGEYDPRQGRYYRLATEILGWTERPSRNASSLTASGKRLVRATAEGKSYLSAEAILSRPIIQRALAFLEAHGPSGATTGQLGRFLAEVTSKEGSTTPGRRASTVLAWLRYIGVAESMDGKWVVRGLPPGIHAVELASETEPIAPRAFDLQEYKAVARRIRQSAATLRVLVDEKKRERATAVHRRLTALVATKIRVAGGMPKFNTFVDLAARLDEADFIFEMKSTTASNAHSQIRRGMAQLYEYRYLMQVSEARLVLVIEKPLPRTLRWVPDFLLDDRGVLLAWNADGEQLHCQPTLKAELSFLVAR